MSRKWTPLLAAVLMLPALSACGGGSSDNSSSSGGDKTYTISSPTDFSGVFAGRAKAVTGTRQYMLDYFNANQGKDLGVKLEQKTYDDGYDQAKAAQLAPKLLGTEKGIGILFSGAPILQGLGQRLTSSDIPAINCGPPYSFNKGPGNVFSPIGDIGLQWATGVKEIASSWTGASPMKVALVSFDGASGQDFVSSASAGLSDGSVDIVLKQFIPPTATDVGVNVEKIMSANPDLVVLGTTDALQPQLLNTLKQRGFDMSKVLLSMHEGIAQMQSLGVSSDVLNGVREVTTLNYVDHTSEAYKIFEAAQKSGKYPEIAWNTPNLLNLPCASIISQAVAKATKAKNGGKITSKDVLKALDSGTFDGLGLQADITFDPKDRTKGATSAWLYQLNNGQIKVLKADLPLVSAS